MVGNATRPIDRILIGKRLRQDVGDLDGLSASIAEVGLLHPIVVTPDNRLVAGYRRLLACRQLGWSEVPVYIIEEP
jgi:ParB family chromosome partitioning protein